MNKITEEDRKALEAFPEYKGGDYPYVGTRDYWEGVFESETNRDTGLHEEFSKLHKEIVDKVITFCRDRGINDVDEFHISADGIIGSIPYGEWCPCTDSSMSMVKAKMVNAKKDKRGWVLLDREHPFLFEI